MADRFKDQYWFKLLKWHTYKRFRKPGNWHTKFQFDRVARTLRPGDIVLDCGANVGKYTALLAATGATVHAFEPDPYSFAELEKNTSKLPNVHRHNVAVGVGTGEVQIFRAAGFDDDPSKASLSTSVFADKTNISTEKAVSVSQIDLLDFATSLDRPVALTKIDVEGAEIPIIEHIIEQQAVEIFGVIFAETHEGKIPSLQARTDRLRKVCRMRFPQQIHLDWD